MKIIAIDPANEFSAFVVYGDGDILAKDKTLNENLRVILKNNYYGVEHLAIEMIASYGMAVGQTVFETCLWTGRFIEAWGKSFTKVYRKDVKMHLCNSMRAKDANIRQAIIDRYPPSGGGKIPQIGTKAKQGALYGVCADMWAALAVAITYTETVNKH